MRGAGEAESRRTEPEPLVEIRGRGVVCVAGVRVVEVLVEVRVVALRRRLESGDLLSGSLGDCAELALELGERPRFEVSLIQLRRERRWLMKGCFRRRLGMKPLGWRRSELLDTV